MNLAVIKTGGKQYKVASGQKIEIEKIEGSEGDAVIFDEVLLLAGENSVKIGQPNIEGAKVAAKILKQGRADKIIIFKYKAKKRSKVKKGHRQPFSLMEIGEIK